MLCYFTIVLTTIAVPLHAHPKRIDLIDALVRDGGQWILAAAASTFVPPPFKSCVNITAKLLPNTFSECVLANLNLTVSKVRHVQFVGQNEDGDVEIRSKGPIHQYLIKRRTESEYTASYEKKYYAPILNDADWEAAVNQPVCWKPRVRPYQFVEYRYVVTPIDYRTEAVYLVGIKKRWPLPEYQVAILTKGVRERYEVEFWINLINWRNFDKMDGCREDAGHGHLWPPKHGPNILKTIPHFWTYYVYCLPRLHIKCAKEYDILDMRDPVNHRTPHENFNKHNPSFKYSFETDSLLVVPHHK